jgi:hypothetical protein
MLNRKFRKLTVLLAMMLALLLVACGGAEQIEQAVEQVQKRRPKLPRPWRL